ncbi:hypothetical protein [Natronorubrum sp. A-ect3]|uniref:hypothetical protein n=1 Tax=Natronorubrum sp. A-ect3 TaxID=3242698 RepID=UPI00359E3542
MFNTNTRLSTAERKELVQLLLNVIVIGICLALLPDLIWRGWYSGDPGHITQTVLTLGEPVGLTLAVLQAFVVGAFFGLLGVLLLDRKKKAQAALLLAGVCAFGYALIAHAGFIPQIVMQSLGDYLLPLGLGFLAGVVTCVGFVSPTVLVDRNRTVTTEFRRGARLTAGVIVLSAAAMFVETTFVYPSLHVTLEGVTAEPHWFLDVRLENLVTDLLVITGLTWSLRNFVRYDRSSTPVVLGPSGTGKTYFMLGAYFEDRQTDAATTHSASSALTEKATELEQWVRTQDAEDAGWYIDSTDAGNTELLEYIRESGSVLPRDVTVTSLDYAGENLAGLAHVLENDLSVDDLSRSDLPPGSNLDDVKRMKDHVERADTLLFLLDAKELFGESRVATDGGISSSFAEMGNNTEGSGESDRADKSANASMSAGTPSESSLADIVAYDSILSEYGDEKRIVFVVTKADILDTEYRDHYGIDIYDRTELDRFAKLVTEDLKRQDMTDALLARSGVDEVYPVYFRTTVSENGQRVPVRRSSGPLTPFGFTRLMEDL